VTGLQHFKIGFNEAAGEKGMLLWQICEERLLNSSCPSVLSHGTTRLQVERFL